MKRNLCRDKFIDTYLFDVDYELIYMDNNVYTFEFWATRRNKSNSSDIINSNYSASITIVDKKTQDIDPLIYTLLLLEANDGGLVARQFLEEAARLEGVL